MYLVITNYKEDMCRAIHFKKNIYSSIAISKPYYILPKTITKNKIKRIT